MFASTSTGRGCMEMKNSKCAFVTGVTIGKQRRFPFSSQAGAHLSLPAACSHLHQSWSCTSSFTTLDWSFSWDTRSFFNEPGLTHLPWTCSPHYFGVQPQPPPSALPTSQSHHCSIPLNWYVILTSSTRISTHWKPISISSWLYGEGAVFCIWCVPIHIPKIYPQLLVSLFHQWSHVVILLELHRQDWAGGENKSAFLNNTASQSSFPANGATVPTFKSSQPWWHNNGHISPNQFNSLFSD